MAVDGLLKSLVGTLVGSFLILMPLDAIAQDQSDVSSLTTLGIEQSDVRTVLRALYQRQQRMEDSLARLDARLAAVAEQAARTQARIERGDDPLVALEIEQLWTVVRSLERENAILTDRLEALGAPQVED